MKPPLEQNYYELLEVPRDATIAELDRAYDRAKAYYGPGSIATYSLTSPDELKLVQDRIDEAYLVLAEENARAEYLARIGPPTPDERPLHREVREAQAEREAARDKEQAQADQRDALQQEAQQAAVPTPGATAASSPDATTHTGEVTAEARRSTSQEAPATQETPTDRSDPPPAPPSDKPAESVPTPVVVPASRDSEPEVASTRPEGEERVVRTSSSPGPVPPPLMEYPEPSPNRAAAKARPESPRPAARAVELPPDAVFSGELLRQVRESLGLSLQELSDKTKIGKNHLDNIEADRYDALPAQVYLRGFLMSYARVVKLDPLRVAKSYLDAASRAKPAKAR